MLLPRPLFLLLLGSTLLSAASVSSSVTGTWTGQNYPCMDVRFDSNPSHMVCSESPLANGHTIEVDTDATASAALSTGSDYGVLKGYSYLSITSADLNPVDFGTNTFDYKMTTTSTFSDSWTTPGSVGEYATLSISYVFEGTIDGTGSAEMTFYVYDPYSINAPFLDHQTTLSNNLHTYQVQVPLGRTLLVQNTLNTTAEVQVTGTQNLPLFGTSDVSHTVAIKSVLLMDGSGNDLASGIVAQSGSTLPLTATAPEPGTLLLGAGALAMVALGRKKR